MAKGSTITQRRYELTTLNGRSFSRCCQNKPRGLPRADDRKVLKEAGAPAPPESNMAWSRVVARRNNHPAPMSKGRLLATAGRYRFV